MTSKVKAALGIDCGGTATRWLLIDEAGRALANGEDKGATGHVFAADARAHTRAVLSRICNEVALQSAPPQTVTAGITGLTNISKETVTIRDWLAADLSLFPGHIEVVDDMWIAFHTVFDPGTGIVVYSGTGAVATHIDANGTISKTGAHGHIIDDGGSAYWVGQRAINWLMRAWDEENAPPTTNLAEQLYERMGGPNWEPIREFIYRDSRAHVARLAQCVGAAAKTGDKTAIRILKGAGRELARLANVLAQRTGPQPVGLIGGNSRLHPAIQHTFMHCLERGRIATKPDGKPDLRQAERTPVEAAAQLALARAMVT